MREQPGAAVTSLVHPPSSAALLALSTTAFWLLHVALLAPSLPDLWGDSDTVTHFFLPKTLNTHDATGFPPSFLADAFLSLKSSHQPQALVPSGNHAPWPWHQVPLVSRQPPVKIVIHHEGIIGGREQ